MLIKKEVYFKFVIKYWNWVYFINIYLNRHHELQEVYKRIAKLFDKEERTSDDSSRKKYLLNHVFVLSAYKVIDELHRYTSSKTRVASRNILCVYNPELIKKEFESFVKDWSISEKFKV